MATYGTLKTMTAAAIGTIMPWGGDLTAIPPGWLICNGQRIEAGDYPLLTQMMGDNYGGDNLAGTFPNYSGGIFLPNINQRGLVDIEASYFDNSNDIDTTIALAALTEQGTTTSLIGPDTDNSAGAPTSAYTDINFSYTPENDFLGKLTGANLNDTFGAKTVYTSARKLGRKHTSIHSHTETFDTIYQGGSSGLKPGAGVAAWGEVNYRISRASFDELDYGKVQAQLEIQYTSQQGFGGGQPGVFICNVGGENPTFNLKANEVKGSPIANWFGSDSYLIASNQGNPPSYSMDEQFLNGDTLLHMSGGGTSTIPVRNFDPGGASSGDAVAFTKTLFNRDAISFNQTTGIAGRDVIIEPHQHEPFEVFFDLANQRLPTTTNVNVISNVVPDNIDKAFNINVNPATPSLICLYIIRAY
ncbi:MAG: hypothetical protein CL961_07130 [Euryarchaeota archaeon]|nr:hypothetical protein [Euryarchaeota archaeon]|tara:strand:- start:8281 stop:9525 length:1245 start_codon:yes stop_codon:yes gene_type:complete